MSAGGGGARVEGVDHLGDQARDRGRVAQVGDRASGGGAGGLHEVGGVGAGEVEPPERPGVVGRGAVGVRPVGGQEHRAAWSDGDLAFFGAAPAVAAGAQEHEVLACAVGALAAVADRVREPAGIGDQQFP